MSGMSFTLIVGVGAQMQLAFFFVPLFFLFFLFCLCDPLRVDECCGLDKGHFSAGVWRRKPQPKYSARQDGLSPRSRNFFL